MVERYKDTEMQEIVKRSIRAAMAQESISYGSLSAKLRENGVLQTESTLRTKVSTGMMTTSLYIHILHVLNVETLSIRQLIEQYSKIKKSYKNQ